MKKTRLFIFLIIIIIASSIIDARKPAKYLRLEDFRHKSSDDTQTQEFVRNIDQLTIRTNFIRFNSVQPFFFNKVLKDLKSKSLTDNTNETQQCSLFLTSKCEGDELVSFIKKNPKPPCQDQEISRKNCKTEKNPLLYPSECYEMGCKSGLLASSCSPMLKPKDKSPEWCAPITENPCTFWLGNDLKQEECCVPETTKSFEINEKVAQGIIDIGKKLEKGEKEDIITAVGSVCAASLASAYGLEDKFDLLRRIKDMTKFGPITVSGSPDKAKITYENPDCKDKKISVEITKDKITFGCEIKF